MAASSGENSYKNILKGTSVFGGVQAFQILINLIRGKFVALFLGPAGMGVSSLFNIASTTVQQFASLGLNLSIVKEVASIKDDSLKLSTVFSVARTLVLMSAIAGAVFCVLFSSILSGWTFGNGGYWPDFMLVGCVVFFAILGGGELSLLQGLHAVKQLSRASVVGASVGLCVGVPLYYFYGTDGIVPAMLALSLSMYLFYRYSVGRTCQVAVVRFSWNEHRPIVKGLVSLGLVMMVSSLLGTVCTYLLNLFIRVTGDMNDVGFYQAANSITAQYSGLVFAAMSLDYFPRLSAVAEDNIMVRKLVNRQTELVSWVLTPLVILLFIVASVVVTILLSRDFETIVPLVRWMGLGVLIKALSYPMGYIAFAKGDKRLFFWLEGMAGNLLFLGLGCVFFNIYGIIGLGVSMTVSAAVAYVAYMFITYCRYSCYMSRGVTINAVVALSLAGGAFVGAVLADDFWGLIVDSLLLVVSVTVSFLNLKRKWRVNDL